MVMLLKQLARQSKISPMLTFVLFFCYRKTGVNTKQIFGKYHSHFVKTGFNVLIANTDI